MSHELVHGARLMAFHKVRFVTIAGEKVSQVRVSQTSEDGWVGDFVPVQVEDRKNGAVASRIQKLIGVPTGSERASLGFAIANDTANQQVRIVERGTIGVGNRVPSSPPSWIEPGVSG